MTEQKSVLRATSATTVTYYYTQYFCFGDNFKGTFLLRYFDARPLRGGMILTSFFVLLSLYIFLLTIGNLLLFLSNNIFYIIYDDIYHIMMWHYFTHLNLILLII
jgi:hypothetical protein